MWSLQWVQGMSVAQKRAHVGVGRGIGSIANRDRIKGSEIENAAILPQISECERQIRSSSDMRVPSMEHNAMFTLLVFPRNDFQPSA